MKRFSSLWKDYSKEKKTSIMLPVENLLVWGFFFPEELSKETKPGPLRSCPVTCGGGEAPQKDREDGREARNSREERRATRGPG